MERESTECNFTVYLYYPYGEVARCNNTGKMLLFSQSTNFDVCPAAHKGTLFARYVVVEMRDRFPYARPKRMLGT